VAAKFDVTIIHGDCPTGADHWARVYCEITGTPQERYPAKWTTQGDMAGFTRNTEMANLDPPADLCLAFPGGPGTADMVAKASAKGIVIKLIKAREDDRTQSVQEPHPETSARETEHAQADSPGA
jgi:hypothetical protein